MIKQFSVLRFVLILMIFFHHLGLYEGGGPAGVASFFVLSGFCMTLGYKDSIINKNKEQFNYIAYIKKRIVKFVPLHWVCLLIVLLPSLISGATPDIRILVSNIALLQSWIPNTDYYFSFNALSWYLSDTMFLAIIFPPILLFVGNQRKEVLKTLLILMFGIYLALLLVVPKSMRHALLYINPLCRAFDFVIGIFTALFYVKYREKDDFVRYWKKHKYLLDTIIIASILGLILLSVLLKGDYLLITGVFWPIIIIVIISIAFQQDTLLLTFLNCRGVQVVTQSTFSFYMIHVICRKQIELVAPNLSGITRIVVVFFVTYVLSQLLYYMIEKCFTRYLQSWIFRND